jgi:hypothetical protein
VRLAGPPGGELFYQHYEPINRRLGCRRMLASEPRSPLLAVWAKRHEIRWPTPREAARSTGAATSLGLGRRAGGERTQSFRPMLAVGFRVHKIVDDVNRCSHKRRRRRPGTRVRSTASRKGARSRGPRTRARFRPLRDAEQLEPV